MQNLLANSLFMTKKIGVRCVMSARREISAVSGRERKRIKYVAVLLSVFGPEGNIFSICCSTGEFLFVCLKVIMTANLFFVFFTDS
jgi:hypothetical protein